MFFVHFNVLLHLLLKSRMMFILYTSFNRGKFYREKCGGVVISYSCSCVVGMCENAVSSLKLTRTEKRKDF